MEKRVEHVHDQLAAFYPEYTAQGNMTRLIYQDPEADKTSSMIDPRQVESVKRALARFYAVDLRAQAEILRRTYHRRILLHFFLPDYRVFVPFKLRESRISGDACYGYVDIDHVARLVPGNKPYVLMRSGERLSLYSSISTARLAYFMGWEIVSDFACAPDELDLVHALTILRGVFAGDSQPKQGPSRKRQAMFSPNK